MQPTLTAMPSLTLAAFAEAQSVGLTRFAYVLCGDRGRAEDLVQDAFAALYRRFGDTLTLEAPVAYARRAIVNAHVSERRRRASTAIVLIDPPELSTPGPDGGEQDAMWRALATLPERQRAVLVLRYYLDMSDEDIAATLVIVRSQRQEPSTPPAGLPASAFTSFDVTGYPVTSRETLGDGARSVTVRTPHGAASGDVAVTLWAPHSYTFTRLEHQVVVQVSGRRGYAGADATAQYRNHDRPIHAVVWKFAPDQWAVAQQVGDVSRVPSPAAIIAVARATRPHQHLPLSTPFRLDALRPGTASITSSSRPTSCSCCCTQVATIRWNSSRSRRTDALPLPNPGPSSTATAI